MAAAPFRRDETDANANQNTSSGLQHGKWCSDKSYRPAAQRTTVPAPRSLNLAMATFAAADNRAVFLEQMVQKVKEAPILAITQGSHYIGMHKARLHMQIRPT